MRVHISRQARADVALIGDWIARDDPDRARSFTRELLEKAQQIGAMPLGYPLVDETISGTMRRRIHGDYLIFYHVNADRVDIVRILHGARDYRSLLGSDFLNS